MQQLNVLIVGEGKSLRLLSDSKHINKLYITEDINNNHILLIKFNTFKELAKRCKALKIDLVIVEDEKWILQGIVDVLKNNYINTLGITSKWTNLILSNEYRINLLSKYNIKTPSIYLLPKEFPVVLCADGIRVDVNSLQEIISVKKQIFDSSPKIASTVYLEEKISNKEIIISSIFDGETVLSFPHKDVTLSALNNYSKNLENMFKTEKANFVGFINSKVVVRDGVIYNIGFDAQFPQINCEQDLMYILISVIYQKLHEISLL